MSRINENRLWRRLLCAIGDHKCTNLTEQLPNGCYPAGTIEDTAYRRGFTAGRDFVLKARNTPDTVADDARNPRNTP